jgi:hypothetical protein
MCSRRSLQELSSTTNQEHNAAIDRWIGSGRNSKAIKDARHVQPAAPGPVAGVVDRRMPDARVAGTIMGI